jgi:hypothetical protein
MKRNIVLGFAVFLSLINPVYSKETSAVEFLKSKVALVASGRSDSEAVIDALVDYREMSRTVLEGTWESLPEERREALGVYFKLSRASSKIADKETEERQYY